MLYRVYELAKSECGNCRVFENKFPEAKLVCMLQDLVSTQQVRFSTERFDCDRIKQQFDLVLSFDARDCVTYGFIYHPFVFSSYHGKLKNMP